MRGVREGVKATLSLHVQTSSAFRARPSHASEVCLRDTAWGGQLLAVALCDCLCDTLPGCPRVSLSLTPALRDTALTLVSLVVRRGAEEVNNEYDESPPRQLSGLGWGWAGVG